MKWASVYALLGTLEHMTNAAPTAQCRTYGTEDLFELFYQYEVLTAQGPFGAIAHGEEEDTEIV